MAQAKTDLPPFEEVAMPLFRPLYNFACWLARDRSVAEDLVQETYTRALKAYQSFQPGTNFRAWMFTILRNTFLTQQGRTKAVTHVPYEEEGEEAVMPMTESTPETVLLGSDLRDQIQKALERLPAQYREVVLLCDVEEMRYQEIAETLQVPIGTVMSRLSRARKMMRGMLAEERIGR